MSLKLWVLSHLLYNLIFIINLSHSYYHFRCSTDEEVKIQGSDFTGFTVHSLLYYFFQEQSSAWQLRFWHFPRFPSFLSSPASDGNVASWDPRQHREKAPKPKSWFTRNKQCFLFPYRMFPCCIRGIILFMGDSFPKNPKFGEMV